ncbi:MAG: hypothetical protein MR991_00105 [Clostridiales bacterium]|nr:hypothetical protein [Clostridiales bacterium]MDD7036131.1 hypothetical protein [Bacillota bacterium]MDY2920237.1 hypothetical protein [Lentihominibacter sp.]
MNLTKRIIATAVIVAVGALSFFALSGWATTEDSYKGTYKELNRLQDNALALTAGATAAATAAAVIPGDATTPVANKLADVAGYMVIVYVAITAEKYITTLTGLLLFKIMIPVIALLAAAGLLIEGWERSRNLHYILAKILAVGLVLWLLVPVSMTISGTIYDTYTASAEAEMEQVQEENAKLEQEAEKKKAEESEDKNIFVRIYDNLADKATDTKTSVTKKVKEFEAALNNMIEGLAVMIVTTCVIPIAVMALMLWIAKVCIAPNAQIRLPRELKASKLLKRNNPEGSSDEV